MSMSSRIAVMDAGRILQQGAPRAVYERPASPFVADFVGDANWIPARIVERDGDRVHLRTEAQEAIVATAAPPGEGRAVRLMLRPEQIRLAARPDGADNALPGRIEELAFFGGTAAVQVEVGGGRRIEVRTGGAGEPEPPAPGEPVWLTWNASAGLLFPA
jgi:ABC-type Fe3+/spermidine/putrescine transport system ATPase subunit